jgi:hypothetical protein
VATAVLLALVPSAGVDRGEVFAAVLAPAILTHQAIRTTMM